jgi:hypothetical protein
MYVVFVQVFRSVDSLCRCCVSEYLLSNRFGPHRRRMMMGTIRRQIKKTDCEIIQAYLSHALFRRRDFASYAYAYAYAHNGCASNNHVAHVSNAALLIPYIQYHNATQFLFLFLNHCQPVLLHSAVVRSFMLQPPASCFAKPYVYVILSGFTNNPATRQPSWSVF